MKLGHYENEVSADSLDAAGVAGVLKLILEHLSLTIIKTETPDYTLYRLGNMVRVEPMEGEHGAG
jgi:hypothetical protein